MARIALTIEYDGTAYSGWQRQTNALSVQQVLEEAISRFEQRPVAVTGASRTDAGVHARGQCAHFDARVGIPAEKWSFALNTALPPDIRIRASKMVAETFHARFDACGKWYRYNIYNDRHAPALERHTHTHVSLPLDMERMKRAATHMIGKHDFAAFMASGSVVKDTTRTIHALTVQKSDLHIWIDVVGNGFLYNMVRILAGTLIDVGLHKLSENVLLDMIQKKDRLLGGATAPAHGLVLERVFYPGDAIYSLIDTITP